MEYNFATFKVSDVKVKRVTNMSVAQRTVDSTNRTSICSQLEAYKRNHCTEILMESQFSSTVQASRNNGFVQTVIDCYINHHNLVIRPDDIWMAILTQFSFYINKNSEKFGGEFHHFDDELAIEFDGSFRSATHGVFVTKIKEIVDDNLADKTLKDWILPNFTTTTTNDIISCGIVFMATAKKYFNALGRTEYKGIPYITLEGTIADWEKIVNRLKTLKNYGMEKWHDMLKPILNEFVAAKKTEANVEFWNRIIYHNLRSNSGPSHISGWLTAFTVFNEDGNDCVDLGSLTFPKNRYYEEVWPIIHVNIIPSGCVTINVKIFDDIGRFDSIMFAGHIAYDVWEDDFTLQPQIGWGIALKSTSEEIENIHENTRRNGDFKCDACKTFFKD